MSAAAVREERRRARRPKQAPAARILLVSPMDRPRPTPREPARPRGPRSARAAWLALSACTGGLAACDRAPEPPRATSLEAAASAWPAGTVFVLDGVPVTAEQVDRDADLVALLEPQDSLLQLRRVALGRILFPRLAARGLDPATRERMRAQAEEWREALVADRLPGGPLAGPLPVERRGRLDAFGFELWREVLEAPIGVWSPVVEGLGAFHVFQVQERTALERTAGNLPALVEIRARVYDFPYLDPLRWRADVEAALDRAELTIVDPAWRDVIPTWWQHRMRGGSS